jgi:predicted dehydrogenase
MIHEVCHIFDILRFFAESEVTSVYCVCSRPDDEVIALKFASGCVASIMDSGYVKYDMPKESLEVVTDLGGFTVTDFAEMRTFGLDDFEPRYCFPGHTHPDRDTTHRYLFEALGAEAMLATRRVFYEKNRRLEALRQTNADSPERRELEDYIANHAPLINYMMNKGWIQAVDHFAQCILEGRTPVLANAEDGLRASVLSHAAIRSRETGQVVTVAAGASPDP